MKVVDAKYFESLSSFFKGEKGHQRAEFIIRLLAIDKVNQVYDHSYGYTGAGFTERLLNDLGINYIIGYAERLKLLTAGAVSDFSLKDMRIRDRKWQTSILHLIHSVKVPVLPIRFFDTNSPFFYFLGMINWRIRSLRLPSEVFNKKGQKPRIGIGKIISVQEQEQYTDIGSFGIFLRKAVYEMPVPLSFMHRNNLKSIL